jgi:hypothetical protein
LKKVVRVAAGQGFWGDDLDAPRRQVEQGPIDYLMLDYLAEVTMSILQKQKERDPSLGYARDFVGAMESVLPAVVERGVKVVANAGGVNPVACAAAVKTMADDRGGEGKLPIGVVTGDDLLDRLDQLIAAGHPLANMETGEPLTSVRDRVLSANAYVGSEPIVEALQKGDEVVAAGGIVGKIGKISENYVTLQVTDGVELQLQRSAVQLVLPKGTIKKID